MALFSIQCGERPPNAKLLKGFGGTGVLELLEDDRSGAYRTVYTVRFWSAIYVLRVFQKKSKSGIATPRQEIDRVMERLKQAEAIHNRAHERTKAMSKGYEESSGNIFADLGFKEPEQELLKAKLTSQIYRLLKERGLTQSEAARLLRTTQPQISALMRCKPVSVSTGRLMEFLTILGQDVEVRVKPAADDRTGHMSVVVTPVA